MSTKPSPPMFAIGSREWPGLSKLSEEAGEVVQVIGKLLGSGGNVDHWDGSNLRVRLIEEIADVLAACAFVVEANGFDQATVAERVERKLALFWKWHREQPSSFRAAEPPVGDAIAQDAKLHALAELEQLVKHSKWLDTMGSKEAAWGRAYQEAMRELRAKYGVR